MDSPDGPARTGPEAVLASLDPEQREVALASRGPVCVLAGAGTGKTRAVAHRIAYAVATGVVDPGRVLAVTFTTRAAGELRGRLRQLGASAVPAAGMERVQALTFHAAALRQLTHFWPSHRRRAAAARARLEDQPGVRGGPAAAAVRGPVRAARRRGGDRVGQKSARCARTTIRKQAQNPGERARSRRPPWPGSTPATRNCARERHLVDFESVLELTAAILADNPVAAAASVRARYSYFVVDEYQDVNPLQKLLLDAWLGDSDDVCVVGDPRQTIYSFTGATPAFLTGFAVEFPAATVIRLVRNYRSTPQVVALANRVSGVAVGRLAAQRPGGPA